VLCDPSTMHAQSSASSSSSSSSSLHGMCSERHGAAAQPTCSATNNSKSTDLNFLCPAFPVWCAIKPHCAWHARTVRGTATLWSTPQAATPCAQPRASCLHRIPFLM
jgi:hypothetical protein